MRIFKFILKLIGVTVFALLPVIFLVSIACISSKYDSADLTPIIRYGISIGLLLIMICFSVFCTIYRHRMGEVRKLKELLEQPKSVIGILFTVGIFAALLIEENVSVSNIFIIIAGIIVLCLAGFKYMREPMDYESEYLIELWVCSAIAFYIIGFA